MKRRADTVRTGRHLDVPRQTRVVQLVTPDLRFQQDMHEVITKFREWDLVIRTPHPSRRLSG